MEFSKELLCESIEDSMRLLQDHYDELNRDWLKVNPDWSRYSELERAGILSVFTARDGRELVGYAVFFVYPHLHHMDRVVAVCDVLFLRKDYRLGSNGLRFIQFCEGELRNFGAVKMCVSARPETRLLKLLGAVGYETEEVVFSKSLCNGGESWHSQQ